MLGEHAALQTVALPFREICILNRQLRERRRFSSGQSVTKRQHFAPENRQRPSVGNAVVEHELQFRPIVGDPHQPGPKQRPFR